MSRSVLGFVGFTANPEGQLHDLIKTPKVKGLYIWGGVGQGKTMIMDAFFECLSLKKKMRLHFHQFMLDVHQVETGDPAPQELLLLSCDSRLAFSGLERYVLLIRSFIA